MADLKKGARITGKTRAKLAADIKKKYEKGASVRAIAESTGRSYGFVHRLLADAGVELRGRRTTRSRQGGQHQRQDAHRLVDALPEDRVPAVVALLRREVGEAESGSAQRGFRTVGVFDGEADLGQRSKEIAQRELGGKPSKTA